MTDINKQGIENKTINLLRTKFKFKIEEACFSKGFIPKYILLDRTRNIHSYLVPMSNTEFLQIGKSSFKGSRLESILLEYYKIYYSSLDRPLFLIIENNQTIDFFDISNLKDYFFNTISIEEVFKNKINMIDIYPIIKNEL